MTETQKETCALLWIQYEPKLRAICKAKLENYSLDAEEALGDTYLALCEKIQEEDTIEYPQAWLYKVLNNIIAQKYKTIIHDEKHKVSLTEALNLTHQGFEDDFIERELKQEVLSEINHSLNIEERILYKQIYQDEMSYKDIAKIHQTSESAIKQRKYRLTLKIFLKICKNFKN